jgi:hypothetical protein
MTGSDAGPFDGTRDSGPAKPGASRPAHPRETVLTVPLSDAWFERGADRIDRLLVAIDRPGAIGEFRINLSGGSLTFRHLGDIKGRRVFEASAWHPADDPDLSSRGQLLRLEGPFQRGPRDVA